MLQAVTHRVDYKELLSSLLNSLPKEMLLHQLKALYVVMHGIFLFWLVTMYSSMIQHMERVFHLLRLSGYYFYGG
ncbi:hypothetical protein JY98_19230 [Exiguobacterium mexicanum]|nr:hypothetical protein JY98_19230 [Exiguobacterium mexicanum]